MEIASQVVRTFSDYTRDPAVLYAAKRQAIEEILAWTRRRVSLSRPIRPSIRPWPSDCHVDVTVGPSRERASRSTANRRRLRRTGCSCKRRPPSREGTIVVEAIKGQDRKTIVRKFRLL